jgi:hypothetical protein
MVRPLLFDFAGEISFHLQFLHKHRTNQNSNYKQSYPKKEQQITGVRRQGGEKSTTGLPSPSPDVPGCYLTSTLPVWVPVPLFTLQLSTSAPRS